MPWSTPPDVWGMLGAILIAILSGFISVANRIVKGHPFSLLWFAVEMLGAILAGYLMWDMYPAIKAELPNWATMPILVSLAAHTGGKCFQLLEKVTTKRFSLPSLDDNKG